MKTNSRLIEAYFNVRNPHISQVPHVIFDPGKKKLDVVLKKYLDIALSVIDGVPGIWGVPVPYDKIGKPTAEGIDRWGLPVRNEREEREAERFGLVIPLAYDDKGYAVIPDGESALPMDAWSYEENQKVLSIIWDMDNGEDGKMILDCNLYRTELDPLVEAFFEVIRDDITSGIDQLLEELGWLIFPIGSDEEYSVLAAKAKNEKLVNRVIEKFESSHLQYWIAR